MSASGKRRSADNGILSRIVITLIGIGMIFMAVNEAVLCVIGDTAPVSSFSSSRIGGRESEQPSDKEYKWSVSWTFSVDGKEYSGGRTVRGSAISVKHGDTVYYYSFAPQLNSIYAADGLNPWSLVTVALGVFLIAAVNMRKKKQNPKSKYAGKTEAQVLEEMTDYDDSVEQFYEQRE